MEPSGHIVAPASRPAGAFLSWLHDMKAALREEQDAEVPCDECTACCTAGQFIHVGPDERATIEQIPPPLLFPAPGRPDGHLVMGHDEHGHCPMFTDGRCSIYQHRPRACRTYDCRVFPATGIDPAADAQPLIARRAREWRFAVPTHADQTALAAAQAAARYLEDHQDRFKPGVVPKSPPQRAALAIQIQDLFVADNDRDRPRSADLPVVEAEILRRRRAAGAGPST